MTNSESNTPTPEMEPSSNEIGWAFVEEYYTVINQSIDRLHLFYNKSSAVTHGVEAAPLDPVFGQKDINEVVLKEFTNCKVMITNMDCQGTLDSGLLIQVIGEMANEGEPSQKFVQTFVLAKQKKGFYILNDILRYLKEDTDFASDLAESTTEEATTSSVNETPVSQAIPEPAAEKIEQPVEPEPVEEVEEKVDVVAEPEVETEDIKAPESTTKEPETTQDVIEPTPSSTVSDLPKEESEPVTPLSASTASTSQSSPATVSSSAKKPNGDAKPVIAPALPAAPLSWAARAAMKIDSPPPSVPKPKPVVNRPAPTPFVSSTTPVANTTFPNTTNLQSVQGHHRGPKVFFSAYIKHVNESVNEKQLKAALQEIGQVTHFEVARQKNCAFVDFSDLATLKSALALHELKVGDNIVLIEERKRGGAKKNGNNNNNNGNGSVHNNNGPRRQNGNSNTNTNGRKRFN